MLEVEKYQAHQKRFCTAGNNQRCNKQQRHSDFSARLLEPVQLSVNKVRDSFSSTNFYFIPYKSFENKIHNYNKIQYKIQYLRSAKSIFIVIPKLFKGFFEEEGKNWRAITISHRRTNGNTSSSLETEWFHSETKLLQQVHEEWEEN